MIHHSYLDCRDRYIGSDSRGYPCFSDNDCQQFNVQNSTSLCDISVGRCVNTRPWMEYVSIEFSFYFLVIYLFFSAVCLSQQFLNCFISSIPSSYTTALLYYFVHNDFVRFVCCDVFHAQFILMGNSRYLFPKCTIHL
jgi:hypothetical protein